MMLKIVHILFFVFLTEISQDILAESISCSVPIIENGEMGKMERTTRWNSDEEFQKVFPGEQIVSNQTLLLRCRNGFLPIEDSNFLENNLLEVSCNGGAWSKVLRCEQTSCPGGPPAIKNGKPIINSRKHGYTIYYRCKHRTDIKVIGTGVTCEFGKWMGTPPKCLNYPCFTRALNYPGLVKPSQEYLESLESFEIDCENGFRKATTARKINCNRGSWDISQNPCTDDITCPWFFLGNGLNVSYSNENKVESWATFSCAANAKLVGIPYVGCRRDGIWTSSQPYCEDREKHGTTSTTLPGATSSEECFCTYDYENHFVKPQIGHRKLKRGDKIMLGETVSFECKFVGRVLSWQNGLRFFGKANMTCSTCKMWQSKDLPTCNYTVRTDAVIGNEGDLKISPGGVVDMRKAERGQFFCSSTWKHPHWDYGERKGVSVNTTQVSEQGNVIFVSLLDIMRTDHEHSGKYECFMRVGSDQRTGSSFLDLQVDERADKISSTAQPEKISPGSEILHVVNVELPGKENLYVDHNRGCFCTYDYENFYLKAQIGHKILKRGDKVMRGETVSLECNPETMFLTWQNGFRYFGKANMTCSTCESWERKDLPTCTNAVRNYVSCSRFPDSPGLKVTYSRNVSVGSTATFSCLLSSKNLIGTTVSVCRENGSWSNPLPSCEEPKCSVHDLSISVPEDVVPDMTGVNDEFIPPGSVVELKCNDYSIIDGNSKALCGEHGKWEFGSFQCVPGCILNMVRSSHLVVHPLKDSYRLGEFIILSCPPGRKLSKDVEILMCLNKKWSDSIPDCEGSEESDQP